MRVQTDLFHVDTPNANGRVYTQECLEKMAVDMNSGKSDLKGAKVYRAWVEDGKLMAEFEAAGKSCPTCSKRGVTCLTVEHDK